MPGGSPFASPARQILNCRAGILPAGRGGRRPGRPPYNGWDEIDTVGIDFDDLCALRF